MLSRSRRSLGARRCLVGGGRTWGEPCEVEFLYGQRSGPRRICVRIGKPSLCEIRVVA